MKPAARTAAGSKLFRPSRNTHPAAVSSASRASGIWWNSRCPASTTKASASLTADSMSAVRGILVTVGASSSGTQGSWIESSQPDSSSKATTYLVGVSRQSPVLFLNAMPSTAILLVSIVLP